MNEVHAILGLKSEPVASDAPAAATAAPPAAPDERQTPARRIGFAILVLLTACATASVPGVGPGPAADLPALSPEARARAFALEAPAGDALGRRLNLWATHYHTPEVRPAPAAVSAAFPLLDRKGEWISPPLLHRDWCEAALQGSVAIRDGGQTTAYVFVDSNGPEQANCDPYLGSLSDGVKAATRRARFMKVNHPLGCGVRNHPLVPFRTIAVDPAVIPLESVVFVPELRGRAFRLDGRELVHDGYLFAGDRGGAIRGAHIDVFTSEGDAGPLEDLFASTANRTFAAHVVDPAHPAAEAIRATQSASCEAVTPG